jgi:hypothetical protein
MPDGVTLRLQDGTATIFSFYLATDILGSVVASVRDTSATRHSKPVAAVATVSAKSDAFVLAMAGQRLASESSLTSSGATLVRVEWNQEYGEWSPVWAAC